jgi:hypothetical protein
VSSVCADLERALLDGDPESLRAAKAHAESCAACREQLEAWAELEAETPALRKAWESPDLWPRIEQSLRAEVRERAEPRRTWRPRPLTYAALAASVLAAALGAWAFFRVLPSPDQTATGDAERRLLTERALDAVERSEAEYIASIDQLARVAEPLLQKPDSAILVSYREKLQILDAAIAECRTQIEGNRYNAHLRRELLSIYGEKQRTLQQLMEQERNAL